MKIVFDIETDGLKPTKIHCLNYKDIDTGETGSLVDYQAMRDLISRCQVLIGHNIIRFDIPVLEKLLGIKITANKIDTLTLSWYLYPQRMKHGLESFGEEYGIKKPFILDWETLTVEDYQHRCAQDVLINHRLWKEQYKYLLDLYGTPKRLWVFLKYLEQKIFTVHLQEKSRWKVDLDKVRETLGELKKEQEEKVSVLSDILPKVPITSQKELPKRMLNNKGEFTKFAHEWFEILKNMGLPPDTVGPITIIKGEEKGNPNSTDQVKSWLFSLGWQPETFKYVKEPDGSQRAIPQINQEHGKGICPSILKLKANHKEVELLEGLGVLQHRIGILNGFLANQEDGYLVATIAGLTNTLRSKHSIIVNLPKVNKAYAEGIRGSLVARGDNILCGSDMKSLEDKLKQSFVYDYDPNYVDSLNAEGYDPHISIAVTAGIMTQDQGEFYKWYASQN